MLDSVWIKRRYRDYVELSECAHLLQQVLYQEDENVLNSLKSKPRHVDN